MKSVTKQLKTLISGITISDGDFKNAIIAFFNNIDEYIEVTRSELESLIATNSIDKGGCYGITDGVGGTKFIFVFGKGNNTISIAAFNASDSQTGDYDISGDTFTPYANALEVDPVFTSALDTDDTLAANSDLKVASQKAIKGYVDNKGSVLIDYTESHFTTGGSEQDLYVYTIPANKLTHDGDKLVGFFSMEIERHASSRGLIKVYVGTNFIGGNLDMVYSSEDTPIQVNLTIMKISYAYWTCVLEIRRVNLTTGEVVSHSIFNGIYPIDSTSTNLLRVTGQSTGGIDSQIGSEIGYVEFKPAA